MIWIAVVTATALAPPASRPAPLLVCAAVSLTESLEAAAAVYRAEGGEPVLFNFAASNTLARQVVNGVAADLFISADEAQMNVAVSAGAVDRATRVDLLMNRLALIVRAGGPDLRDIGALLGRDVRRVAIGDPDAVPAGVYARRFLEARRLWQPLQPRLVPLANVRAVVAAVEHGGADAGIVYETDAAIAKHATTALVVAGAGAPRIVYPAAVLASSRNPAGARRFLAFLRGPKAAEVFRRHGFTPMSR
jgi:molybdate transport system substrate-binding protein